MSAEREKHQNVIPIKERSDRVNVVPSLAISLVEARERSDLLHQFVRELMMDGLDYGIIEGYQKPTLFKPGAEKLCDIFGFSKQVSINNRIEDWDKGFFAYEVKITLTQKENGIIEAEGLGSSNCKEVAFQHQDPYTIVNTILKMAKKRALVDAVLSATRSSGIFTQDIEDIPLLTSHKRGDKAATAKQLQLLFKTVTELKMSPAVAKEMMWMTYQVDRSSKLSRPQASSFIQDLLLLKTKF
ncbi:hypothetical protein RJD24_01635 [Bacillaceae bacterium IKA-2]|nr:hypothetical protein RJD24_01635 [Bacillaceae bacterium IKA-2]